MALLAGIEFEGIMHWVNLVVSLFIIWKFWGLIELAKKKMFLRHTVQLLAFAFLLFFLLEVAEVTTRIPAFYSSIARLAIELFFMAIVYMAVLKMEKTIISQKYTVHEKKMKNVE